MTETEAEPTISIVDDDPKVCHAMEGVGQILGLRVRAFSSAEGFLSGHDPSLPGCCVSELRLPDLSGPELQQRLIREGWLIPMIFISGQASVRIAVEVMSRGAVTLLEKPCQLDELTANIRRAISLDCEQRAAKLQSEISQVKLSRLTTKEREVLDMVITAMTNKEIARCLHLSVRAVEDRRSRLMKKLGATSIVELVRICHG